MITFPELFDVIVVGAGHAGIEAAHGAASMGAKTLLCTMNLDTIGQMSCNPSIGGIGKGHMVREIDALGGLMGKITDETGIQFRLLNTKKGPAVQAPRAQADKNLYKIRAKEILENTPNLYIKQFLCEGIVTNNGTIEGIETREGFFFRAPCVIITAGTFMQGLIHIGDVNYESGRGGEPPSNKLSSSLKQAGITLARLKTGTPVRLHKRSIDFSETIEQPGDEGVYFSFDEKTKNRPTQLPCHICYTTKETNEVIKQNLHRSPLFKGTIQGTGPRYCPSIEEKIVRFEGKERHQLFLEPEGLHTNEYYLNGASSSLPLDVQLACLQTLPALRNVEIMRPAYAIEYDYVQSGEIQSSLESKKVKGLFFAGQVNGTTGYEEAAAQGLIAAINAVQKLRQKPPIILRRDEAYIGVMIDDLITKGVDEPYRMFTSRAEHRLLLRHDTADLRLRPLGYELGLINDSQYKRVLEKADAIKKESIRLERTFREYNGKNHTLASLLKRPELSYNQLKELFPEDITSYREDIEKEIELHVKYAGYIEREKAECERLKGVEKIAIPQGLNFSLIQGLRTEAKLRFEKVRPVNLGQASRIPGVAPSDISVLMIALTKGHKSCV